MVLRDALAVVAACLAPLAAGPACAEPAGQSASQSAICLMLESAAQDNGLPVAFLTRVIWRESRFDPAAVGPATRSGERAEGIAQFMPGTAAERALDNPFDPVQALPKAAAFLRELAERFGNLGLAAAAYNAGPRRVRDWLAGSGNMPAETRSYVLAITGRSVDDWAMPANTGAKPQAAANPASCAATLAALDQPPGGFAFELNKRVTAAIGKPWGVELAAGFSRERVLASYARAMKRLASVIGDQDPIVTRVLLRSRGPSPLYQARIGADTRPAANALCARIRRSGGACLVLRMRG